MAEVPLITWTQKLVLYETKARYYIVGSNKAETRFRVLKIDRTEPRELLIHDDKVEYSRGEIRSVLSMIDGGNKSKKQGNNVTGLSKNISAFGIAGFVRFMEGYYMILITKRKKAAMIGHHTVYKIEDTSMLYIPNDTVRHVHSDESRYVKMFQNVDLSSNFYFSYSYDLTHSLQYNMTPVFNMRGRTPSAHSNDKTANTSTSTSNSNSTDKYNASNSRQYLVEPRGRMSSSKLDSLWDEEVIQFHGSPFGETTSALSEDKALTDFTDSTFKSESVQPSEKEKKGKTLYGIKSNPNRKFVWNNHLLQGFESCVHSDWVLYVIHGFIGQNNICVFGKSLYITLIGRRSNQFAGTRFLKRGTNHEGFVANEIETEQIVQDTAVTCLDRGKVSSFVQVRGSVPLFWSQDISKMVPKPPISLDQRDPYCSAAGMHFNQLLYRYGSPIIVFNLVKTREKKRHESILSEDFVNTLEYLNQFLPAEHKMQYIGFDMARVNKRKDADVMLRLNRIARYCLKQTGFFLRVQTPQAQYLLQDSELQSLKGVWGPNGMCQTGAVRTNCVDCLDRTNTAQFAMGRSALAYQLYAMGLMERPQLEFDTDCVKLLEELYEDHGDTLALQYGGSQLVHRIKTYRKIAPWTSHSRDIMQTLSRYYSNAFSDLEKQQAFNLFLGVFVPQEGRPNLWDLPTDYYLHNKASMGKPMDRQNYCQWWDSDVWETLPMPRDEINKPKVCHTTILTAPQRDEHVNSFYEHYRPEELSVFDEMYQMYLSNACWKHLPKHSNEFSPFCVRHVAEPSVEKLVESNPGISGKDSTSSTTSFGSEGSSDSSEDSDGDGGVGLSDSSSGDSDSDEGNYLSFKDLFPSMKKVYNTEINSPTARDQKMYERYIDIGRGRSSSRNCSSPERPKSLTGVRRPTISNSSSKKVPPGIDIYPISAFKLDSTFYVEPPPVSRQAKDIYTAYVNRGHQGAQTVSDENRLAYIRYVNKTFQ